MSSHVEGFVPADQNWNDKLAVWNACKKAKVEIPKEIYDFFDGEDPNNKAGKTVDIKAAVKQAALKKLNTEELKALGLQ